MVSLLINIGLCEQCGKECIDSEAVNRLVRKVLKVPAKPNREWV